MIYLKHILYLTMNYLLLEQPEEDEWKEIAEDQEKDYTGLKIGQLQINDDFDEDYENDGEGTNIDGEPNAKSGSGVWKGKQSEAQAAAHAAQVAASSEPVSKTYVIPAMKNIVSKSWLY